MCFRDDAGESAKPTNLLSQEANDFDDAPVSITSKLSGFAALSLDNAGGGAEEEEDFGGLMVGDTDILKGLLIRE